MKIGILGAGFVGGNLGRAFTRMGHEVMFSSREPDGTKMKLLLDEIGYKAQAGTIEDAVAFGELIVVALRWDVIPDVLPNAGDWSGKIIIDTTNRFGDERAISAAEDIATLCQGARVVKAFNTIGAEHYLNPVLDGQTASMFICGDDAEAKQIVGDLVGKMGFEVVDAGTLTSARYLEALGGLWVNMMRQGHGRNIAFRLLRGDGDTD